MSSDRNRRGIARAARSLLAALLTLGAFLTAGVTAADAAGRPAVVRASVGPNGTQADDSIIGHPAISADGRRVAFASAADNLVPQDEGNWFDIFLHDQLLATTNRISVGIDGEEANGASSAPAISGDGRWVAYESYAGNLVPGKSTRGHSHIYLYDSLTHETRRVSNSAGGGPAHGESADAAISADGRYVAYDSTAEDIVRDDRNGYGDVFVWDRLTGHTVKASTGRNGAPANGGSGFPSLSADGSAVAFVSSATNLVLGDTDGVNDIFVRDLPCGTTTWASIGSQGQQGTADADAPALSADGTHVAFHEAGRLTPDDQDWTMDVYVRDLVAGTTTRASTPSLPVPAGKIERGTSYGAVLSQDGRYVAFASFADDLMPGDGTRLQEVYVRDMATNQIVRAASATSHGPALTPDAQHLAFGSPAPDLVPDDTNNADDAFVLTLLGLDD